MFCSEKSNNAIARNATLWTSNHQFCCHFEKELLYLWGNCVSLANRFWAKIFTSFTIFPKFKIVKNWLNVFLWICWTAATFIIAILNRIKTGACTYLNLQLRNLPSWITLNRMLHEWIHIIMHFGNIQEKISVLLDMCRPCYLRDFLSLALFCSLFPSYRFLALTSAHNPPPLASPLCLPLHIPLRMFPRCPLTASLLNMVAMTKRSCSEKAW